MKTNHASFGLSKRLVAWALVALQVALAAMNVRGAKKNDEADEEGEG